MGKGKQCLEVSHDSRMQARERQTGSIKVQYSIHAKQKYMLLNIQINI